MRKLLITLAILIACITGIVAAWIFDGRQISLFLDRFGTIEIDSIKLKSIAYEGSGTGGTLIVNDVRFSLDETPQSLSPSIGSTKDDQFALASYGKVFPFGPATSTTENGMDRLATAPVAGDEAFLVTRRSALSWPTPFEVNFMTGLSPSWKRHLYYHIHWKKRSGATLEMIWRYEQFFYPGSGWANGFMSHEGSTGLIGIEISD